ncbi:uncharacterized protein LOC116367424 isoform X1 [Oncorhynchus kisutch]|uniref:uncharacterized protein LOC116364996 isoform X1 n=1 Tax=Oncorhynchus kisutch TaxID=8019 RepID=UPI0012DC7C86|nr:uncharacterized protein LOC116364996 isoform X1 [Oncorhynchus kisutch]XP_031673636.1 uncharacterized protein LOC116364996 isoform X1 [Oncorhynchus kisutch]XP_031673637.1 uncharacterized protein LOC116364996 isoform X1 [Oncorhynchus kisutch]XP_031674720.1 uncharacterized protein LOC116367424 isoform X1 [Oncorhynchus kisutch]XP_031674721.1 uncharacterized protein LOC116367424 isoform X1 [Oncorhynchus kisutch]
MMVRTSIKRPKKNEGCCRGWIAKWMGRRKERLRDKDMAREVKRMGEKSPGKVSGPVSGKTGLSPLETSAPRTLAEALRALPSAVAPPSPDNVPRPLTPLSPVVITPSSTENFPYRRSPRLAPITNLSVTAPTGERKYKKGIFPGSPRYSSSREEKTHKLTLLYLLVQNIQEGKVNKKKKCKAKKVVKQKKAGKMQQMENVGGSKEEDKKRK